MSDAPAASVNENGVPPFTQDTIEEAPGFKVNISSYPTLSMFISFLKKVFAGNLAYSTTDEGLKAFFAPVQSDMYVASFAQPPSHLIYHFRLASLLKSSCVAHVPQVMDSSLWLLRRLPKKPSSSLTSRTLTAVR
jgi:hypothetical protein